MISALLLAVLPLAVNAVTQVTNYAAGFNSTPAKRFILAVVALLGVVAASALSGNPVDPTSVNSLAQTAVEAFMTFLASHAQYHLFLKRPQA